MSLEGRSRSPANGSMAGKTVVMTGATSGLGAVAAETLAGRGARLVIVARNRERAENTLARLRALNPDARHTAHYADLSRLSEMKRVAAAIAAAEPVVDVLANNAGAVFGSSAVTEDGLERTFAINHMAYFVVTLGLRESLAAAKGARVVSTASAAHRGQRLDAADLQSLRSFNGLSAYGRSKLYNILFTRALARRWQRDGITANSFHPGFVATRFGDESGGWLAPVVRAAKLFAISPAKGARTLVFLASAPEAAGVTGRYFIQSKLAMPTKAASDDGAADTLWSASAALSGLPE